MKDEMIVVRVTSDEKGRISNEAILSNLSVSQYIRQLLNNYNFSNNSMEENISNTPQEICNLFTEIQKVKQVHPEIDFYEIERRAAKLCQ